MDDHTKQGVMIEISRETYDRLKELAVPFEDTPDTMITKLLDRLGTISWVPRVTAPTSDGKTTVTPRANPDIDIVVPNPLAPPDLKHTKVLRAEVNGHQVSKANWTAVRQAVLTLALDQAGLDLRGLLEVCPVNAIAGEKGDEGYTYYPEMGLSIQGQNAANAWQAAATVAKALGVQVKVWFQWRIKPDAENPGKRGLLTVS